MGAISGHRGNEMEKKITRLFFAPPFIATALASLALVPLFLVDLGKAQEKKKTLSKAVHKGGFSKGEHARKQNRNPRT
jgi:hypothetical protein